MMAYKYIITLVLLLVSLGCEQVDIGNGTETGSNDNFSNATVLSGNNIDLTVSFNGATTELGEPNTSGVGGEGTIWYRWTAPYTGNVTIYAAYSGIVYGYTGNNLANLVLVYNGSGSSSSSDTNNISVDAGVIYYFKLSGSSYSVDLFNFFLYADQPAYDNFNTRQTIIGNSGALNNQTLLNATFEADEPYYGPIWYGSTTRQHDGSIWLTWTAPTTGLFDVTLNETYYNSIPSAEIHIYKGNSLVDLVHGTFVDVLHNSGGAFGVIAGQTYQLQITGPSKTRILNYPGYPPDYLPDYGPEFNILWNTVTDFPANDFFSQATLITGETGSLLHQTLTKATKEIGEPVTSYASIWYEWTAGYTGRIQFNAQGIATNQAYAFPVNMTVYTGTDVSSLTEISSNNSNNSLTANVVSGVTYKIRIGSENRCSIRSDGNYCTTEVSSTSPIGGIDDFNLSWKRVYGNNLKIEVSAPRGNLLTNNITYDITIKTSYNTENVTITSTLPTGLSVVSLPSPCSVTSQIVTCFYSSLTTINETMSWILSPATVNTYALPVSISQTYPESYTIDNSVTATTLVANEMIDLSLNITAPQTVDVDAVNQFDITISVVNAGPSTANNVVINYEIPESLFVNAGLLPSSCVLTGIIINCNIPSLAAGTSQNKTISLNIKTPIVLGITFHAVTVASSTTEAVLENNESMGYTSLQGACVVVTCAPQSQQVPLPVWANILLIMIIMYIGIYMTHRKQNR